MPNQQVIRTGQTIDTQKDRLEQYAFIWWPTNQVTDRHKKSIRSGSGEQKKEKFEGKVGKGVEFCKRCEQENIKWWCR